jgi:serine/threonine protein kinase
LIHQNTIKLADFGNSYLQGSEYLQRSSVYGVIPYVDPKFFKSPLYIFNEKSDIYSLGVLFWELTSCSSPFNFKTNDRHIDIMLEIHNGKREVPVPNTNDKFVELYQSKYKTIIIL